LIQVQQANAQNVMIKNMKQVNKMLEHVNKDMNAAELTKVMTEFEKVCLIFLALFIEIIFCF
jgi:hypothetical protein